MSAEASSSDGFSLPIRPAHQARDNEPHSLSSPSHGSSDPYSLRFTRDSLASVPRTNTHVTSLEKPQWFTDDGKARLQEPDLVRLLLLLSSSGVPLENRATLDIDKGCAITPAKLGEGASGLVNQAVYTSADGRQLPVAVKVLKRMQPLAAAQSHESRLTTTILQELLFEIEIMSKCRHPNILRLLALSFDEQAAGDSTVLQPLLVLECADQLTPDLAKYLDSHRPQPPPVADCVGIITGIAQGLAAIHSLGVVHADLKPANILMFRQGSRWTPKLGDFGLSGITMSHDDPRGDTLAWKAPEQFKRPDLDPMLLDYAATATVDVYAFGLIVANILCGDESKLLPDAPGFLLTTSRKFDDKMTEHAWLVISDEMKQGPLGDFGKLIIDDTLRLTPVRRPTALHITQDLLPKLNDVHKIDVMESQIADDEYLTPFGKSSLLTESDFDDMQSLFAYLDLSQFIKAQDIIPDSLSRMLQQQLFEKANNGHFTSLGLANKVATTAFLPVEKLDILQSSDPKIAEFIEAFKVNIDIFRSHFGHLRQHWKGAQEYIEQKRIEHVQSLVDRIANYRCSEDGSSQLHSEVEESSYHLPQEMQTTLRTISSRLAATASEKISDLCAAAYSGNITRMHDLMSATDPQSFATASSWNPIHSAILGKELEALKLLVHSGMSVNASVDIQGTMQWEPLRLALYCCLGDAEAADSAHSTSSFISPETASPTHEITEEDNEVAHEEDATQDSEGKAFEIFKYLVSLEATNLWARDPGYWSCTIAHFAAELMSDSRYLQLLLDREPLLLEARDIRRRTPIHRAAVSSKFDNVKCLLGHGANINSRDAGLSIPLHRAYAAAGGLQGAVLFEEASDRRGERQISNVRGIGDIFGNAAESFKRDFEDALLSGNARQGFQNLDRECPPNHAVFYQIWRGLNAQMDTLYNHFVALLAAYEVSTGKPVTETYPYINFDKVLERIEVNVSGMLEAQEQRLALLPSDKAEGQKGRTYLPPGPGRDIVYLLLENGADARAISKIGYSPECFAYSPPNLSWSLSVLFVDYVRCEPALAFRKDKFLTATGEENPGLYIRPSHGDWSVWYRVDDVLPCPTDLGFHVAWRRWDTKAFAETPPLSDQKIVIEVRALPPNDGNVEETMILCRSVSVRDVMAEAGHNYSFFAGFAPMKHKCDLVINIRSQVRDGQVMPPLCLYALSMCARDKLPMEKIREPILGGEDQCSHPNLRNLDLFPIQTAHSPSPATPQRWCDIKPSASSGNVLDRYRQIARAQKEAETMQLMTLKLPNPAVYTRPTLAIDGHGTFVCGEKTFHFDEKPYGVSHKTIRQLSDGVSPGTARLAARLGPLGWLVVGEKMAASGSSYSSSFSARSLFGRKKR